MVELGHRIGIGIVQTDIPIGIQVHEGSLHISPEELKKAQKMIVAGSPIDEAAEQVIGWGLPSRVRITSDPEVAISVPVRTLVEASTLRDIQKHPMTGAINIEPTL